MLQYCVVLIVAMFENQYQRINYEYCVYRNSILLYCTVHRWLIKGYWCLCCNWQSALGWSTISSVSWRYVGIISWRYVGIMMIVDRRHSTLTVPTTQWITKFGTFWDDSSAGLRRRRLPLSLSDWLVVESIIIDPTVVVRNKVNHCQIKLLTVPPFPVLWALEYGDSTFSARKNWLESREWINYRGI